MIDSDRYSDPDYDNKFKLSDTELTAFWKDKGQELRSNIQDGLESLTQLTKSATKIAAKIGKIASKIAAVAGPIGMFIDFIDSISLTKVSKYTFEYESTKPNNNGELVEDDTQSYKFSYVANNWIWKDDDFDPDAQIRIVTLKEPSIGATYEVDNRLFNSMEYAQMYKKLTVIDKVKEEAQKDLSKVMYGVLGENIAMEENDTSECLKEKITNKLDCVAHTYWKKY